MKIFLCFMFLINFIFMISTCFYHDNLSALYAFNAILFFIILKDEL